MGKQYVVMGLGNYGISVATTLQKLGCDVIAIDRSMEKVQMIADEVSYAVRGDMTDAALLPSLDVENIDGVIVGIADMEASVMATMLAKDAGIPFVLAKADSDMHAAILEKLGAEVTQPEKEMGVRMANTLVSSGFADWITLSKDYSVMELDVPSEWTGRSLRELNIRKKYQVNVVGINSGDEMSINFDPDMPLTEKMILVLIGANSALQKLKNM